MSFEYILTLVFGIIMLAVAWFAIEAREIVDNVIGESLLGLLSVVGFIILQAPDVAVTAAVIGSGLSSAMFVLTMIKMNKAKMREEESK